MEDLPAMAFPFAKVCGADQVLAFELFATVLMHLCPRFFEDAPTPPLDLLAVLDECLEYHDGELWLHLRRCGVDVRTWAWQPLRTLFAEILPTSAWLQLWDHLLTFWRKPQMLLLTTIAFAIHCRNDLLAVPTARSIRLSSELSATIDLDRIFREHRRDLTRTQRSISNFCRTVGRLWTSTPKRLLRAMRVVDPRRSNPEAIDVHAAQLPLKHGLTIYPTFRAFSDEKLVGRHRRDAIEDEEMALRHEREAVERLQRQIAENESEIRKFELRKRFLETETARAARERATRAQELGAKRERLRRERHVVDLERLRVRERAVVESGVESTLNRETTASSVDRRNLSDAVLDARAKDALEADANRRFDRLRATSAFRGRARGFGAVEEISY